MRSHHRAFRCLAAGGLLAGLLAACSSAVQVTGSPDAPSTAGLTGIHKIQHVIIVMQENRSFDSYFGTYPGADGIPMRHGAPAVCVPGPAGRCIRPYHNPADVSGGGPHGLKDAIGDINRGKMNGFLVQRAKAARTCKFAQDPQCAPGSSRDVMGYHTAAEIPNYWAYAKNFVLTDHMYEPVKSWSLPDHLYMVSAWSAKCASASPMSCVNNIGGPDKGKLVGQAVAQELSTGTTSIDMAWTDITWLLHAHHVSWRYYVQQGSQPDCANSSALTCSPVQQRASTPGIWNPLPLFEDVQQDHQLGNIRGLGAYFAAAKAGTLPAVSWITPSQLDSEHPPASIHQGQAYVTAVINAAMKSPDWNSTAIFLSWDDWGGFYDHVVPTTSTTTATGCASRGSSSLPTPRRASSTTRRSAATPSSSSSRTTSSAVPGSTRRPTGAPIPGPSAGERAAARQPDQGLQLRPAAAQAVPAAHQPGDRLIVGPAVLHRRTGLRGVHGAAARLRVPGGRSPQTPARRAGRRVTAPPQAATLARASRIRRAYSAASSSLA